MRGERGDITQDLHGLGIPALVLAGEQEEAFAAIKRFAALLPARFEMLPGKTHIASFSAAHEVCNALIAFLEEIDNGHFSPLMASSHAAHHRL
jgi:pimeloyl-ACP methyl ester carboxylesterase